MHPTMLASAICGTTVSTDSASPTLGSSDESDYHNATSDDFTADDMLLSDSKHTRIVQWTNSVSAESVGVRDFLPPAGGVTDWDGRSDSSGAALLDALQELDSVQLAQLYLRATEAAEHAQESASNVATESSPLAKDDAPLSSGELADLVAEHLRRRDKELELAARAGQELLLRNAALSKDLSMTAAERDELEQQSAQLRHDIAAKEQLLRMYMIELNEIQDAAEIRSSPAVRAQHRPVYSSVNAEQYHPVDDCSDLQAANEQLSEEMLAVKQQAEEMERRERELIAECVRQVCLAISFPIVIWIKVKDNFVHHRNTII